MQKPGLHRLGSKSMQKPGLHRLGPTCWLARPNPFFKRVALYLPSVAGLADLRWTGAGPRGKAQALNPKHQGPETLNPEP